MIWTMTITEPWTCAGTACWWTDGAEGTPPLTRTKLLGTSWKYFRGTNYNTQTNPLEWVCWIILVYVSTYSWELTCDPDPAQISYHGCNWTWPVHHHHYFLMSKHDVTVYMELTDRYITPYHFWLQINSHLFIRMKSGMVYLTPTHSHPS